MNTASRDQQAAALAKEWGTAPRPGAPGKTVWAELGAPA